AAHQPLPAQERPRDQGAVERQDERAVGSAALVPGHPLPLQPASRQRVLAGRPRHRRDHGGRGADRALPGARAAVRPTLALLLGLRAGLLLRRSRLRHDPLRAEAPRSPRATEILARGVAAACRAAPEGRGARAAASGVPSAAPRAPPGAPAPLRREPGEPGPPLDRALSRAWSRPIAVTTSASRSSRRSV